ncbi:MBL fold metallo-hydrolase [Domibacillus enclensis]|uniref:Glyoxylase, beta-lactamase superfamily II n=1 Tax=Domibacillus enclensis TaxID=1017273 RepID=A0A1N7BD39_9BACI|nr:MBL fold metallo-hydrolase [Domibacillus enclensis]OXS74683.1 MBL fold metallo-hydrolase [Domibacillus enclensis]SIR49257.1 Glyoxylase, beta-lactamase superfamily II [Domibacillus enclensis]
MVRIQKAGPLHQLSFLPSFFPVNCYIVEEETSLTLIDAALPFSVKDIMGMVKKLEKPIEHIVLTHAHEDHVGALDALKAMLPDVPVYLSERDTRLLNGDLSVDPEEPQKPIKGGLPKRMNTRPDVQLNDGDRIGSLEAIFTPGHTPGSMSFYDHRNGQIIAGDALQTRGGIAVSGTVKPLFPFPALATWDKETAIESAKRIQSLNPSLLAVGHGQMMTEPEYAIQRAIGEAERKQERKRSR